MARSLRTKAADIAYGRIKSSPDVRALALEFLSLKAQIDGFKVQNSIRNSRLKQALVELETYVRTPSNPLFQKAGVQKAIQILRRHKVIE